MDKKKQLPLKTARYGFTYRSYTEYALKLEKWIVDRVKKLGPRLQVLKVLIHREHKHRRAKLGHADYGKYMTGFIADLLVARDFRLEELIDEYRARKTPLPELVVCEACKYRPVFCMCKGENNGRV